MIRVKLYLACLDVSLIRIDSIEKEGPNFIQNKMFQREYFKIACLNILDPQFKIV
jgi:hypothetical protein